VDGTARYVRLRADELGQVYPGLLDSILARTPAPR
jgi:hypothetical protein